MTKSKNTKRALLMSILSMFLCVSMLVSSTFAWFTDSVTSGKNQIVAGNLDVELYNVKDGKETPVKADTNLFLKDALWEPGHVEVVNLKVANVGTLALTYKFGINIEDQQGSVNVHGRTFKLSDHIWFALIDGNYTYADREAAIADAEANNPAKLTKLIAPQEENGVLYPVGKGVSEKYVTLVVYMPWETDNEANYRQGEAIPTIELGVNLIATQTPYESDSFNGQYDSNAADDVLTGTSEWFDAEKYAETAEYTISNAADLLALQQAVAQRYDFSGKIVTLADDVDLSAYGNWAPIGSELAPFAGTFDGANKTISGLTITKADNGFAGLFGVINGAEIKDLTVSGNITIGDSEEFEVLKVGGIAGASKGDMTITGCTNNVAIDVSNANIVEGGGVLVGGIVGDVLHGQGTGRKITIAHCTNNAALTASETVVSIVGGMTSSTYQGTYNFEGSVNNGTLTGMAAGLARDGLVGLSH